MPKAKQLMAERPDSEPLTSSRRAESSRSLTFIPFDRLSPSALYSIFTLLFIATYFPVLWTRGVEAAWEIAIDFPSFYAASVATFTSGVSPYDSEAIKNLAPGRVWPFLYPPPSLVLLYPLSWAPYSEAEAAFLIFNHVALCALSLLVPLWLLKLQLQKQFITVLLLSTSIVHATSSGATLGVGQVNLALALLLVGFWGFANRGRVWTASACLALAIALKAYPVLLLPLLLACGRKDLVIRTVAVLVVLALVSALMIPPPVWIDWAFRVLPNGAYGGNPAGLAASFSLDNQSINALMTRAFSEPPAGLTSDLSLRPLCVNPALGKAIAYALSLAIGALTIRLAYRAGIVPMNTGSVIDTVMLGGLPMIFLVAPISWTHHQVYLLPVMAMLWSRALTLERWRAFASGTFVALTFWFLDFVAIGLLNSLTVTAIWGFAVLSRARAHEDLLPAVYSRA